MLVTPTERQLRYTCIFRNCNLVLIDLISKIKFGMTQLNKITVQYTKIIYESL